MLSNGLPFTATCWTKAFEKFGFQHVQEFGSRRNCFYENSGLCPNVQRHDYGHMWRRSCSYSIGFAELRAAFEQPW